MPVPAAAILFDGWSLVNHPNSYEALHLLEILHSFPLEFQPILALPGDTIHPLPERIEILDDLHAASDLNRLRWEQSRLEKLSRQTNARLLHLTSSTPALFARTPVIISQAETVPILASIQGLLDDRRVKRGGGFFERARKAAAHGGMERINGLVVPVDVPTPAIKHTVYQLPASTHPEFYRDEDPIRSESGDYGQPDPDDTYLLYHGAGSPEELEVLLDCWLKVTSVLGSDFSLKLAGLDERARLLAENMTGQHDLKESITFIPDLPFPAVVELYHQCSGVICPGPSPVWGGSLRAGIASRKPVVALETNISDAIAGPAAYLVASAPVRTLSRSLSAALITILVEEPVLGALIQSAHTRSLSWRGDQYREQLSKLYSRLFTL